jgi:lysosomal alpha-mannosidase
MKLFSEMGFDAVFMARIDHTDKEKRVKDKTLEFIWTPEGSNDQIFAHILWNHYSSPIGFMFDVLD